MTSSEETDDRGDAGGKSDIEIPLESQALHHAFKKSNLTAADLAAASGMSVGAVRVALSGLRYRKGVPEAVVPPDHTLAKLASLLGVPDTLLSAVGRERAGTLMVKSRELPQADLDAAAVIAGRSAVVGQVLEAFSIYEVLNNYSLKEVLRVYPRHEILGAFSSDVLRREIKRREEEGRADVDPDGHDGAPPREETRRKSKLQKQEEQDILYVQLQQDLGHM